MADLTDREQLVILSTKMDTMMVVVSETQQAVKETRKELSNKIDTVDEKLRRDFVTKSEFEPIKRLVYGAVGLVLTAMVIAIISLVINSAASGIMP